MKPLTLEPLLLEVLAAPRFKGLFKLEELKEIAECLDAYSLEPCQLKLD